MVANIAMLNDRSSNFLLVSVLMVLVGELVFGFISQQYYSPLVISLASSGVINEDQKLVQVSRFP